MSLVYDLSWDFDISIWRNTKYGNLREVSGCDLPYTELENASASHCRPHHTEARHIFRFVRRTTIMLGSCSRMWCLPTTYNWSFGCPNREAEILRCFFTEKKEIKDNFFQNRILPLLVSSARNIRVFAQTEISGWNPRVRRFTPSNFKFPPQIDESRILGFVRRHREMLIDQCSVRHTDYRL